MNAAAQLQELLRRLFRLDEPPDLDFGIHRVINRKREKMSAYVDEQLPQKIADILNKHGGGADQTQRDALQRIRDGIGDDGFDQNGELLPVLAKTTIGRDYLRLRNQVGDALPQQETEEAIYGHLAEFFGRYECGGDFAPRRRHSVRNRYALPHNGEEVLMHWANRDQYYIKSAAYHPAVAFKVQGKRFQLQIAEARDIPRDNNKDTGRFLFPQIAKAAPDHNGDIVIPCVFRAPDKKEQERLTEIANGENGNGNKIQRGILAEALNQLKEAAENNPALRPLLIANAGGEESAFMRHARRFIRRNTADFFIHRNLRKFLTEELDLYLKNEVINAEELAGLSGFAIAARMVAFRAIRELGEDIIDALAEWENLQKNLWEKKKIILSTEYCIAVGRIPNAEESGILDDIAECDTQWTEWKELGINCGKKRKDYLRENLSLPIDTANFSPEFKDRLLAQFSNIDDATDGVLIHGENWQALNLIREMYRGQVQCIHIDPPYNTDTSGFLYKNEFRHSSWIAMMDSRISAALPLLSGNGAFMCHIDENEYERLHLLFEQTSTLNAGTVVWDKKNPILAGKGIATQHEYIILRTMHENAVYLRNKHAKSIIAMAQRLIRKHKGVNDESRKAFADWIANAKNLSGGERAYSHIDKNGKIFRGVAMAWPNPSQPPEQYFIPLMHPITGKPCPVPGGGWSQSPEKMAKLLERDEIIFGKDETVQPQKKIFLTEDSRRQLPSILRMVSRGSKDLQAMGMSFSYCHPVMLYEDILGAGAPNMSDIVLDFFAGSGTTAHAVMNLNREDGGRRKFILAEAGEHFNTTLLPRVKKVIYSPEWKDSKPSRKATAEEINRSPRLVKYQRIESYEDTLENIRFESDGLDLENITPRYELEWESRKNPARIVESGLENPFSYTLELAVENGENGQEARKTTADLPETFAYLIGLRVLTCRVVKDGRGARHLVQRGKWEGRDTAVIWRDTTGWNEEDFEGDRKFIQEELAPEAERILVNGSACGQGMESLNPIFAKKMFPEGEGE